MLIFADANDALAPPTTLLGIIAVLSTGVSGLLGVVVKWLLNHITVLTAQNSSIVVQHGTDIKQARDSYQSSLGSVGDRFEKAIEKVIDHCQKEMNRRDDITNDREERLTEDFVNIRKVLEDFKETMIEHHQLIQGIVKPKRTPHRPNEGPVPPK